MGKVCVHMGVNTLLSFGQHGEGKGTREDKNDHHKKLPHFHAKTSSIVEHDLIFIWKKQETENEKYYINLKEISTELAYTYILDAHIQLGELLEQIHFASLMETSRG